MSIKLEALLSEPSDSEGVALFEALKHRRKYLTVMPSKTKRKKMKTIPKNSSAQRMKLKKPKKPVRKKKGK